MSKIVLKVKKSIPENRSKPLQESIDLGIDIESYRDI
jgi:hypothetical protein